MVSAITERPYTFLRWLTGTLPGRKPLRRTLSLRSTRRASALASRSEAGTLILNSCFNPSARVSVTCMASIFFRFRPAFWPRQCPIGRRAANACAGGSADPHPQGGSWPSSILQANAESAWCGRRDSNPHNFRHWNLNPARLPVPPRPLADSIISGREAAGGGLITWANPFAAKKWPFLNCPGQLVTAGQISKKMVRIGPMASPKFQLNRRDVMTGLGAVALCPAFPAMAAAQGRTALALRAKADRISLRPGGPDTPVWSLGSGDLRFKGGDTLDVTFANELPAPAVLDWRGIDGAPAAEPLTSRPAIAGGAKDTFQVPLRHPGTFLCDAGLLGDGGTRPIRPLAVIVTEALPVAVD